MGKKVGIVCGYLSIVFALVVLNGCVLVPFVQAFKESGLTEGDRMELLPPQVKRFSDARVFGNKTEALSLVSDESRPEIAKQLQDAKEPERIVKSQIDAIEWSNDAFNAKVILKVEAFKMSELVVRTVTEEQHWEFRSGTGWLLNYREKMTS